MLLRYAERQSTRWWGISLACQPDSDICLYESSPTMPQQLNNLSYDFNPILPVVSLMQCSDSVEWGASLSRVVLSPNICQQEGKRAD